MKSIIVDDEYPSREEMKYFIKNYSNIEIVDEFEDSFKTLKYLEDNNPDVIFLDINMPGMNGLELAKIINKFNKKPIVIFITAYKEYAVEAFEIKAFDYIMKPFSKKRIKDVLERVEELELSQKEKAENACITDKIPVKKGDIIIMKKISDICCCKSFKKQTIIYTNKDEYILNCCISKLFQKLPRKTFFKSHRCYIINMEKVEEIIPWFNGTYCVKIKGIKGNIPISRKKVNKFKQFIGL